MMTAVRGANLALKFALELAAFAALAVTAAAIDAPLAVRILAAIALPLGAIAIWGRWCAPRARRRLATTPRIAVELAVLLAGAALLGVVIHAAYGVGLAALVVVNTVLLIALADEAA